MYTLQKRGSHRFPLCHHLVSPHEQQNQADCMCRKEDFNLSKAVLVSGQRNGKILDEAIGNLDNQLLRVEQFNDLDGFSTSTRIKNTTNSTNSPLEPPAAA